NRSLGQIHETSGIKQVQKLSRCVLRIQTFQDDSLKVFIKEQLDPKARCERHFLWGVQRDSVLTALHRCTSTILYLYQVASLIHMFRSDLNLFLRWAGQEIVD